VPPRRKTRSTGFANDSVRAFGFLLKINRANFDAIPPLALVAESRQLSHA
jgi:hypothetical protein